MCRRYGGGYTGVDGDGAEIAKAKARGLLGELAVLDEPPLPPQPAVKNAHAETTNSEMHRRGRRTGRREAVLCTVAANSD